MYSTQFDDLRACAGQHLQGGPMRFSLMMSSISSRNLYQCKARRKPGSENGYAHPHCAPTSIELRRLAIETTEVSR